jgi:nucleotide-binding universal stress UspA family protein
MTMLTHILVPLDGSPLAETALLPASILAQRFGACLVLLVHSTDTWPKEAPSPADSLLAAFQAGDYLTAIARRLRDAGLTVQVEVIAEAPSSGISAEAQEHQADLIVMATHGRQGLDALLHPSVTWGVLRQSRAPILTWKITETAGHPSNSSGLPRFLQDAAAPILVPLDGSLLAEQALPIAEELAQRLGNPLVLVRAAEQPSIAGSTLEYPAVLAQAQAWSLAEATSYLERKCLELSSTGLQVEIDSQLGDAASIVEATVQNHQAGLVMMASHGRSGLGRLLLGSVARRLLNRLEVPIVLVRDQQPAQVSVEAPEGDR